MAFSWEPSQHSKVEASRLCAWAQMATDKKLITCDVHQLQHNDGLVAMLRDSGNMIALQ